MQIFIYISAPCVSYIILPQTGRPDNTLKTTDKNNAPATVSTLRDNIFPGIASKRRRVIRRRAEVIGSSSVRRRVEVIGGRMARRPAAQHRLGRSQSPQIFLLTEKQYPLLPPGGEKPVPRRNFPPARQAAATTRTGPAPNRIPTRHPGVHFPFGTQTEQGQREISLILSPPCIIFAEDKPPHG